MFAVPPKSQSQRRNEKELVMMKNKCSSSTYRMNVEQKSSCLYFGHALAIQLQNHEDAMASLLVVYVFNLYINIGLRQNWPFKHVCTQKPRNTRARNLPPTYTFILLLFYILAAIKRRCCPFDVLHLILSRGVLSMVYSVLYYELFVYVCMYESISCSDAFEF